MLGDVPVFHAFAGPFGFAQKGEAGFHGGIELKATHGNPLGHFAVAVFTHEVVQDGFERDAMQRVARMMGGRRHGSEGFSDQVVVGVADDLHLGEFADGYVTAPAFALLRRGKHVNPAVDVRRIGLAASD